MVRETIRQVVEDDMGFADKGAGTYDGDEFLKLL